MLSETDLGKLGVSANKLQSPSARGRKCDWGRRGNFLWCAEIYLAPSWAAPKDTAMVKSEGLEQDFTLRERLLGGVPKKC